jgi:tetratricopeptide (TPR) repeat protein
MIAKRILPAQKMKLEQITFLLLAVVAGAGPLSARQTSPAAVAPAHAAPAFDPYHAEKSIEVGAFYLKTGKYDAAIDRFEEAARLQPKLAEPWRWMGEAYEKKQDFRKAIDSYEKYLALYPSAPDHAKVKKRITKLTRKLNRKSSERTAP